MTKVHTQKPVARKKKVTKKPTAEVKPTDQVQPTDVATVEESQAADAEPTTDAKPIEEMTVDETPLDELGQEPDKQLGDAHTDGPSESTQDDEPAKETDSASVTIRIPIGSAEHSGYEFDQARAGKLKMGSGGTHLQCNLTPENATTFLDVRQGLRDTNAKLGNGRPVFTSADAFRWILEEIEQSRKTNSSELDIRFD